jgi:hypothetical protein
MCGNMRCISRLKLGAVTHVVAGFFISPFIHASCDLLHESTKLTPHPLLDTVRLDCRLHTEPSKGSKVAQLPPQPLWHATFLPLPTNIFFYFFYFFLNVGRQTLSYMPQCHKVYKVPLKISCSAERPTTL